MKKMKVAARRCRICLDIKPKAEFVSLSTPKGRITTNVCYSCDLKRKSTDKKMLEDRLRGISYKDIAEKYGISESAAKDRVRSIV